MAKSTGQAQIDMRAMKTKAALSCYKALVVQQLSSSGEKFQSFVQIRSLPSLGQDRVEFSGVLSGAIHADFYFYLQGRAEIYLSVLGIGSSFPAATFARLAGKVVTRAANLSK
jgi:hypothetical protein